MSKPDFYTPAVQYVVQKDTHISKVFLTGDMVYKIKKQIDFGFLDFSSLAKRRRYCELEVALNRRLTDHVYLDVVPIRASGNRFHLSGSGTIIEYAVRMRQLPDTRCMSFLLKQDRINTEQIKALAVLLTDFYTQQQPVPPKQAAAAWENIKYACEENFRQTRWAVGELLNADQYKSICCATRNFLARRKALFNIRSENAKICDCHGDLRCCHIYYLGPDANRIQIIDCIEFNTRLRCIDIASDLAFLAMDLELRGAPALSSTLIEQYTRKTKDWQVYAMMPFYKCYRAMVRCKVTCIRLKDKSHAGEDPTTLRHKADRYLSLAHSHAEHFNRPTIWVLCGLPGTGKSTIARILSQILLAPDLRSDVIRKQLYGRYAEKRTTMEFEQGIYSPDAHRHTYETLLLLARKAIEQRESIILDATFSQPEHRRQVIRLAKKLQCRVLFVECRAPDHVIKARLLKREGTQSISDARLQHFEMLKDRYVPLDEADRSIRLRVDTTGPIHECIQGILAWDDKAVSISADKPRFPSAMTYQKGGSHVQDNSGSNGPSHRARSFGGNGSTAGRCEPRTAIYPPRS